MSAANLAKHVESEHFAFWQMLKRGHDQFELTRQPVKVDVCGKGYVFNTRSDGTYRAGDACPPMTMNASLAMSYLGKARQEAKAFEKLLGKEKAVEAGLTAVTLETALPGIALDTPSVGSVTSAAKTTTPGG